MAEKRADIQRSPVHSDIDRPWRPWRRLPTLGNDFMRTDRFKRAQMDAKEQSRGEKEKRSSWFKEKPEPALKPSWAKGKGPEIKSHSERYREWTVQQERAAFAQKAGSRAGENGRTRDENTPAPVKAPARGR